ncbi:MAG: LacI family DNA-binding transcriptional regulator [Eubacteriales bacterium]|nr:LacI family DNA-binding transcriptional regulator [Eubacteriales bacterium]
MNIGEIAKLAGVSSAAVSRYFNNGYISEEKKEIIRKVVEETGYRPSVQAQTLRTKKTKLVGVILPKIDSAAIGSVVAGIHTVLNVSGYQLLLADTQNNPDKELEYLSTFNDKQVDGVIFIATIFTAKHRRALKSMSVPVVIVGQKLSGYHCVYHDDYHAIYEMTKLLAEKGCRRLGYIGVLHQDKAAGQERYEGYCRAVTDRGLEECRENVVISDFTIRSGYEKAETLLKKYGPLDGIVCATDAIAIGTMRYLKDQNIEIPGQMLITGHGDSSLSRVTTPTLTTVHYSYEKSGELATGMLLDILAGKEVAVKEMKLGFSIVENESSRKR